MSTPQSFRALIGVPPSTASPTDSALIIIDAQNEYATGALKTTNVDSTRGAIKGLLEKYRNAGGDVVHVLHQTPEGAPVFTPGKGVAEEMSELKAREGEKVCARGCGCRGGRGAGGEKRGWGWGGDEGMGKKIEANERENQTIQKNHPSSFAGTDLHAYLEKAGKKKVVLTGYMVRPPLSLTCHLP